ncbi:MAG: DUF58 domain-containing protein [Treponema sp.]|nr:DUF58 domain-containing protein [Treponema sp.]
MNLAVVNPGSVNPAVVILRAGQKVLSFIPRPKTLGAFVALIAAVAFVAGYIRKEFVLTLLGSVFLAALVYCFTVVLLLAMLYRKKTQTVSADIVNKKVKAGGQGEMYFPKGVKFFNFPGAVIRYVLKLETKDKRKIDHIFNPRLPDRAFVSFPVPLRGAYYGANDEFLFFDALGFFQLKVPVPREKEARLLAAPIEAEMKVPLNIRSGGSEQRREIHYKKTDDFTENRPYVPGDDPRRINWKLYSHGIGSDLYVREGENAPPPHSKLLILIDTQIDPVLYSSEESLAEVDMLCENALRAIRELTQMEISIGFTGGKILQAEDAVSEAHDRAVNDASGLAWPFALPLSEGTLPEAPEDRGILILALPRTLSITGPGEYASALDRFLASRINNPMSQMEVDILFLYTGTGKKADEQEEAARLCTTFYNRKNKVHANWIMVKNDIEEKLK